MLLQMQKMDVAKSFYDAILFCSKDSTAKERLLHCDNDEEKTIVIEKNCFKSKLFLPLSSIGNSDAFIAELTANITFANSQKSRNTAIIFSSDAMGDWLDRKLFLRMINTIVSLVEESEMKVCLVLPETFFLHKHQLLEPELNSYVETLIIKSKYSLLENKIADAIISLFGRNLNGLHEAGTEFAAYKKKNLDQTPENCKALFDEMPAKVPTGLYHFLKENEGERFPAMLKRLISERGMTASQCYNKANVSRKVYWKILHEVNYRPSKPTVLAFAVALELNLKETRDLLENAGYSLSRSEKFDLIVEYHIQEGIYDTYVINCALFLFDQVLLGA